MGCFALWTALSASEPERAGSHSPSCPVWKPTHRPAVTLKVKSKNAARKHCDQSFQNAFGLACLPVLELQSRSSSQIPAVVGAFPRVEMRVAGSSENAAGSHVALSFVCPFSEAKAGGPSGRCCPGEAGPGVQGVEGEAAASRAEAESCSVPADLEEPCARRRAREGRGESLPRGGEAAPLGSAASVGPFVAVRDPASRLAVGLRLGAPSQAPPPGSRRSSRRAGPCPPCNQSQSSYSFLTVLSGGREPCRP